MLALALMLALPAVAREPAPAASAQVAGRDEAAAAEQALRARELRARERAEREALQRARAAQAAEMRAREARGTGERSRRAVTATPPPARPAAKPATATTERSPRAAGRGTDPGGVRASGGLPHWYELDLETRQALPELSLTVHYFSQDPTARFVKLNGERYREGDKVSGPLRLHEIRRDGVVLQFRRARFLYGFPR